MIDVSKLTDDQLVRFINNRWTEAGSLWSEIEEHYAENKKRWQNNPDWVKEVPKKRSKARDNRLFLATESVITNLTGRPSKPNAIPANETDEAKVISDNLQEFVLDRYKKIKMKKKMRKGLRQLFFSRLVVLKVFWDSAFDNFDEKPVSPLKIRFTPITALEKEEVEVWMEEIDCSLSEMLDRFEDKKAAILSQTGFNAEEDIYINNPKEKYYEVWINGEWVVYKFRNTILKRELNPYWDWQGIKMLERETAELENKRAGGQRKRAFMARVKGYQGFRSKKESQQRFDYDTYFYNHFDKPQAPYIFGTVFEEEDKPFGDTSLIEQAIPLQDEIDKRKRQFSDNADMMNGVWKVDTGITGMSKADAQRAKADPRGIIYGKGVREGVIRETGKELPSFLKDDMIHSISEVDNIFGTQPTFRGEKGTQETATGRAILREQSYQRLNELIDLVDSLHEQSYNWWLQMMKARYTVKHLIKVIGREKAITTLSLMQDDFDEGIEIGVVPGQILPEDKVYRVDRATEAAKAGIIDPLSYFEATEWDNPMKQAKRFVMYQANPFSLIDLDQEDIAKLQQAAQLLGQSQGGENQDQKKAQQISAVRQEAEKLINSAEFKNLPEDQKRSAMTEIRNRLDALTKAK